MEELEELNWQEAAVKGRSKRDLHHDEHQRKVLYASASLVNFKLHSRCDGGQKACNANSVYCLGFETERLGAYLRPTY